jgi:hypothetical protein
MKEENSWKLENRLGITGAAWERVNGMGRVNGRKQ